MQIRQFIPTFFWRTHFSDRGQSEEHFGTQEVESWWGCTVAPVGPRTIGFCTKHVMRNLIYIIKKKHGAKNLYFCSVQLASRFRHKIEANGLLIMCNFLFHEDMLILQLFESILKSVHLMLVYKYGRYEAKKNNDFQMELRPCQILSNG